jgi:molybdopterin molybdotransferase
MSSALVSVAWADGLIDNPAGQTIARGDIVRYLPMASLLN